MHKKEEIQMANINVTLPDGSKKEVPAGSSLLEIAKGIAQGLGKKALLAEVDGKNMDLSDTLDKDAEVKFITLICRKDSMLSVIQHPMLWLRLFSIYSRQLNLLSDPLLIQDSIMIWIVTMFSLPKI